MTKTQKIVLCAAVVAFLGSPCMELSAQKPACGEVNAMARMARAISSKDLADNKLIAGYSYRAQVIFAIKQLELYPQKRDAALQLLNLIPKDDQQQHLLMTLGDHLCGTESYHDMKLFDQIWDRLPHEWSRAVLLVPDKIPEYVAYSLTSVQDPHSDYAVQMQKVCHAKHPEFVEAVTKLPREKRDRFLKYVFDLDGCNALTLPEADNRLF